MKQDDVGDHVIEDEKNEKTLEKGEERQHDCQITNYNKIQSK